MDEFIQYFEAGIPELKEKILDAFNTNISKSGFRIVWQHFEDIINPILVEFFQQPPLNIATHHIFATKSKSVYPDLKVKYKDKNYAVDVKSGEDKINPWYDIGRLDTYEEKHLEVYAAEYCITVKWSGRPVSKVLDVYIEPTYKSVGYKASYNGVLYRPYDGKLRPKSWSDFEAGKSYWQSIEHFKQGLYAAKKHRRVALMTEWYRAMDYEERSSFRNNLDIIDANDKNPS